MTALGNSGGPIGALAGLLSVKVVPGIIAHIYSRYCGGNWPNQVPILGIDIRGQFVFHVDIIFPDKGTHTDLLHLLLSFRRQHNWNIGTTTTNRPDDDYESQASQK